MLSISTSPNFLGAGRVIQSPADESYLCPVSPAPSFPRCATRNLRSTFPSERTQSKKRSLPISAVNSTEPTAPVIRYSKRKKDNQKRLSTDDWAKRLKLDYFQDSDYDIVGTEYLLFREYAARVPLPCENPVRCLRPVTEPFYS